MYLQGYNNNKSQVMKSILTVVFVIVLGVFAQAKNTPADIKVETIVKTIVITEELTEEVRDENTLEVARLYRRKNSRVKKALSFYTKRNRSKMA